MATTATSAVGDSRGRVNLRKPAFGTEVVTLARIKERGAQIVDTTCGDVMSVWKRVRQNASDDVTSIIHGKASHEETKATASRAVVAGKGHYLVVLTLADTDYVCDYIRHGGDRAAFLEKFHGAFSEGFDPDQHLRRVGVANQTTLMRGETEEVQRRAEAAIRNRDGAEQARASFRFFDTISGATHERQDALREMLTSPMDLLPSSTSINTRTAKWRPPTGCPPARSPSASPPVRAVRIISSRKCCSGSSPSAESPRRNSKAASPQAQDRRHDHHQGS